MTFGGPAFFSSQRPPGGGSGTGSTYAPPAVWNLNLVAGGYIVPAQTAIALNLT